MNIREAARRLNKSEQFIRIGLQSGRLTFGSAVKTSSKWSYHIPDEAFENYMKGLNNEHQKNQQGNNEMVLQREDTIDSRQI